MQEAALFGLAERYMNAQDIVLSPVLICVLGVLQMLAQHTGNSKHNETCLLAKHNDVILILIDNRLTVSLGGGNAGSYMLGERRLRKG